MAAPANPALAMQAAIRQNAMVTQDYLSEMSKSVPRPAEPNPAATLCYKMTHR